MPRLATDYIIIHCTATRPSQDIGLKKSITGTEPEVGLAAAIILSLEEMVR